MTDPVRPLRPRALALLLLAEGALAFWINAVAFPRGLFAPVAAATGGWVAPTLAAGLLCLAVAAALLFGPGGLRPRDAGWRASDLRPAAAVLLAVWAGLHLLAAAGAARAGLPLAPAPAWSERGVALVVGGLLAQLVSTALVEETLFRGVLLPQARLRLAARLPGWAALPLAVVLSQALFAAMHLPNRLSLGTGGAALAADGAMLFTVGVVFSLLYLATRNLFVCIGLHALFNAPVLLLAWDDAAARNALLAATLLLTVGWRPAASLLARRGARLAPVPA